MSRRQLRLWGAAALLLVALLAWLRWGVEWVEESADVGAGPEARRNPFLAAELFLEARGVDVETVSGLQLLDELPPLGDTVIVTTSRRSASERRTAQLERWIRSGGHAVLLASEHWDEEAQQSRDPLLDLFGIRLRDASWQADDALDEEGEEQWKNEWTDEREVEGEDEREDEREDEGEDEREVAREDEGEDEGGEVGEPEDEEEKDEEEEDVPQTFTELLEMIGQPPACDEGDEHLAFLVDRDASDDTKIALDHASHIATRWWPADFELASHNGTQIAGIDVDLGRLTVVTGFAPFTNRHIHCHDHAYVLARMVSGSPKVWMLHDPAMPGLGEIVAGAAPLTCLAAGLLVLGLGASQSLRFGSKPAPVERARRDLVEHIEAAASLRWRATRLEPELAEMRDALPAPPRRASPEKTDAYGEVAEGALPRSRRELTRWIQAHQRIGRTP